MTSQPSAGTGSRDPTKATCVKVSRQPAPHVFSQREEAGAGGFKEMPSV